MCQTCQANAVCKSTASTCYKDKDLDTFGDPAGQVTVCGACGGSNVANKTDCDDSNSAVHPGADYSLTPRASGSFDMDCDSAIQVKSVMGNLSFACVDGSNVKQSDCSKCNFTFVAIDASDCGQHRCSAGGDDYIECK